MLKQQAHLLTIAAIILDILMIVSSFFLSHVLICRLDVESLNIHEYIWFLFFIIPVWFCTLYYFGIYESLRSKQTGQILANIFKAHLTASIVTSSMIFFAEQHTPAKNLFLIFVCISLFSLVSGKMVLRIVLYQLRNRGYNTRNLLLVSSGSKADDFIRLIEQHAAWGFRIAGIIGESAAISDWGKHYPYCGEIDDIVSVCMQDMVDEVVFCLPRSESGPIDGLIHDLNELGITTRMVLDLIDFPANRSELSIFHDELPMLTFYSKAFDAKQLLAKRVLDILGACLGLVLFGIMLPLLVLLIRRDSSGPIFFCQVRVGENGRRFRCWKLRTMYVDAEQRKQELLEQNEMSGAMFKIKNDPRITPFGSFLRKTSLDEFPQFWNVMRGEMSLVGTRPPTPDEVIQYENWHRKRICIKPGLTGLWQVSGRNQIQDFNEVARLDIRYIENWSIWLDLKIILKTIWVVTGGRGAS